MLYYQTVSSDLITILKRLMSFSELTEFRLVGGTALALQIGHRKSVDIDLFCSRDFNNKELQYFIKDKFKNFILDWENKNGFVAQIDNIKVDFFNWSIPFVYPVTEIDSFRMAGKREIAAMKIEAITGRKEKKDFIDIAVLLKEYELKELLMAFKLRYPFISHKFAIESLMAVDYADESVNPEILIDYKWDEVKRDIIKSVENYFTNQLEISEQAKKERLKKAEELLKKKRKEE